MQQEVHDPRFPKLSSRVYYLKEQEGGVAAMCEIMEKYMDEAKAAGIREEKRLAICRMIKKEFDKQTILDLGYTELEYEEAREFMSASV